MPFGRDRPEREKRGGQAWAGKARERGEKGVDLGRGGGRGELFELVFV